MAETGTADTFPRLLQLHARQRPGATAIREKDLGIWQSWSWSQMQAEVQQIAAGLHQAGFQRGDHLAIVGENRPRLYFTMIAVQCLGGIPVPLYQDAVAAEMAFVFANAEIKFAVAEDQEQVDKLLEVRESVPHLRRIIYEDPRGLRNYDQPGLASYEQIRALGEQFLKERPTLVDDEIARGRADDVAAMFYTSGTTGNPKGVVLGYGNLLAAGRAGAVMENLTDREEVLAYLPMAWIGQNIFSYTQWLVCGFTVNCPESASTVMADMREIGPTYYFAPPRVLEGLLTQVMIRMEDASAVKRRMFHYFMEVARRVGGRLLDKQPVGPGDRLLYGLGDWLVYAPLRNALGMSRIRVAYTAGEAIGPDLFTFYRSLGINLKQLYGSTETSVFVCVQPNGGVKPDTVGPPVAGVEIRLTDAGEILIRSPGLFREYYKSPEATRDAKDGEGWFHTGDAGYFDAEGHLKIIDRAKDVGKLADGTLFAPKYIENKLKFFPTIKEAVAFGDQREMVCAFVNIDMEAVGNWAERHNLPYTGYTDLAGKPEVLELIRESVERVNADLANDPKLANAQIRRFIVLHKELDADDEELTRTRKVRRRFIQDKYSVLVDAMYSGRKEQFIETMVKFEDGRTGKVAATLQVRDAKTFAPMQKAA
ncbi:MAG TPA: AMP-binding protein [Burkholderiaceae bacterium]|nr:AMP-binding protein [Burkholderiaceae bacterium]HQR69624.1 AMP-binding protein [Burkholderiaceae bacterium]